jgi:RES domain-containing protein
MATLVSRPATFALGAPFAAAAVCSGPATEYLDVADLVTIDGNRWSASGEATLYLAGDVGTALAEVGRHWKPGSGQICLWHVRLELAAAVDLRRPEVRSAVGVPDDPRWFLDRGRCRELASRVRQGGFDGVIVPSVAFLDDLERWNAVVFADQASRLAQQVRGPRPIASLDQAITTQRWTPPPDGARRRRPGSGKESIDA